MRQFVAVEGTERDVIEVHYRGGTEQQMASWLGDDLVYREQEVYAENLSASISSSLQTIMLD